MLRNKYDYDIFILGGGSAGIRAALTLAAAGKRVGLAEPAEFGGYEILEGYAERAPLVQAAGFYANVKTATAIGIRGGSVGYNYPTLRQWSHDSTEQARRHDHIKAQLETAGVSLYPEAARFIGPHEVALGRQHVSSTHFLIATGSVVTVPSTISGLTSVPYLTPKTAADLLKPPKSVFIIGGGKTGVEFAGLFSTFGSTVYIAEIAPRLLPEEDLEAGEAVKRELEARGSEVLSSTRVTSVSKEGLLHRVTYLRGDVEHVIKVEHILLAGGRAPYLDLGLDNAEVEHSPLGIAVTPSLQTSARHIYAAGSVTGNVRGPEGATLEAEQAALNILRRDKTTVSYAGLPTVIYGQPNVARVGVNEGEALRKDIPINAATVELSETVFGRANRATGLVKLIADRKGALIGAVIVGPGAADAINTLALAIETGITIEKLSQLPLAYGSLGEAITKAARALNAG